MARCAAIDYRRSVGVAGERATAALTLQNAAWWHPVKKSQENSDVAERQPLKPWVGDGSQSSV